MAYDDVARKATVKYIKEKQRQITIRYQKDDFENRIKPAIDRSGMKLTTFIKQAVDEKIERDQLG